MSFVAVVPNGLPVLFFQSNSLFWMLIQNVSTGKIQMWNSPDGTTWTEQGAGGESSTLGWPASPVVAVWDGAHTVTVAFQQGIFSGNTFLQQFNLTTASWGVPFAEQSGGDLVPFFVGLQSGGNIVVVWQDISANPDLYKAQIWNGATWGALIDVCAGAEALPAFNPAITIFPFVSAVLDAGNVLHVIYDTFSTDPTWNNRYFYQEVTAAGALQNFHEFPGQTPPNQDLAALARQPAPNLFISGNSLLWGILRKNYSSGPATYPATYTGTPLVNPVWTESGNLDPTAGALQLPLSAPVWALNTTTGQVYEAYIRETPDGNGTQVQLLLGGNSITLSDSEAGGAFLGPGQFGPFFSFTGGVFMATGGPPGEGPSIPAAFTPVSTAGSFQMRITLRGVNRRRCDPGDGEATTVVSSAPSVKRAV
jgi:hypothetical protein